MSVFDGWDLAELIAARRKLQDALARGVMSVNYNGEMVTFSTPAAMRQTIGEMTRAIQILDPENRPRPASTILISTPSRGVGPV